MQAPAGALLALSAALALLQPIPAHAKELINHHLELLCRELENPAVPENRRILIVVRMNQMGARAQPAFSRVLGTLENERSDRVAGHIGELLAELARDDSERKSLRAVLGDRMQIARPQKPYCLSRMVKAAANAGFVSMPASNIVKRSLRLCRGPSCLPLAASAMNAFPSDAVGSVEALTERLSNNPEILADLIAKLRNDFMGSRPKNTIPYIRLMIHLLKNRDGLVTREASAALGQSGPEAIPMLTELLKNTFECIDDAKARPTGKLTGAGTCKTRAPETVRCVAAEALRDLAAVFPDEPAFRASNDIIRRMLEDDPKPSNQYMALEALGASGRYAADALDAIRQSLFNGQAQVPLFAAEALGRICASLPPAHYARQAAISKNLAQAITSTRSQDWLVSASLTAFSRCAQSARRSRVASVALEMANRQAPELRQSALRAIGRLMPRLPQDRIRAEQLIRQALGSGDLRTQGAAIEATTGWGKRGPLRMGLDLCARQCGSEPLKSACRGLIDETRQLTDGDLASIRNQFVAAAECHAPDLLIKRAGQIRSDWIAWLECLSANPARMPPAMEALLEAAGTMTRVRTLFDEDTLRAAVSLLEKARKGNSNELDLVILTLSKELEARRSSSAGRLRRFLKFSPWTYLHTAVLAIVVYVLCQVSLLALWLASPQTAIRLLDIDQELVAFKSLGFDIRPTAILLFRAWGDNQRTRNAIARQMRKDSRVTENRLDTAKRFMPAWVDMHVGGTAPERTLVDEKYIKERISTANRLKVNVVGEMVSGRRALGARLARRLCRKENSVQRIPVVLDENEFVGLGTNGEELIMERINAFLRDHMGSNNTPQNFIDSLILNGHVVLVVNNADRLSDQASADGASGNGHSAMISAVANRFRFVVLTSSREKLAGRIHKKSLGFEAWEIRSEDFGTDPSVIKNNISYRIKRYGRPNTASPSNLDAAGVIDAAERVAVGFYLASEPFRAAVGNDTVYVAPDPNTYSQEDLSMLVHLGILEERNSDHETSGYGFKSPVIREVFLGLGTLKRRPEKLAEVASGRHPRKFWEALTDESTHDSEPSQSL